MPFAGRRATYSAVVLLAHAGALGSLAVLGACRPTPEATPEPPQVRVVAVAREIFHERLRLPARLQPPADLDRQLAPQVAGRLVAVAVRAGDPVVQGALLAEVETGALDDARRSAAADLERARLEERAKRDAAELTNRLFERGIASREERDADASAAAAASAGRAEAEARVAEATRERERARLTAPFDGVVVALLRHPGETVDGTPATPVLRLAGSARSEVVASATSAALARIATGMPGTFEVGGQRLAVRVARVARALDPATGVGEVAGSLAAPASGHAARPVEAPPLFSTGELELVLAERSAVLIPAAAVRRGEDGTNEVLIVKDATARTQAVTLGDRDGDRVEVVRGLAGGEAIVADGGLGIADGTAVRVQTEATAPETGGTAAPARPDAAPRPQAPADQG